MDFITWITNPEVLSYLTIVAIIWALPWKGVSLWMAARRKHRVWFVVLLIVNTLAILEILYIFVFSKMGQKKKLKKNKVKKKKR